MEKTRKVIKFEDLPDEVVEVLDEEYPDGWDDQLRKITKPNGEIFHAFSLETDRISYLVKVQLDIDLNDDMDLLQTMKQAKIFLYMFPD